MAVPPTTLRDEFRRTARAARAAFVTSLSAERRAALNIALIERLVPLLAGRECVAGYAAFNDEIDPAGADFALWPRVGAPGLPLTFHRVAATALEVGGWGILEPRADAPLGRPDAVIVPLLAVDPRGFRLGYGKGHYDRTLAHLDALRIGVAWDCQIVERVPEATWDERLDWLVTPTQTLKCGADAPGRCDPATVGDGGGGG